MDMTPLDRDANANLFEQLANRLEQLIVQGTLEPGQRLPSIRRLRQQFGVSISTVMEAMRLLEDRGLIETRPQSGHFVRQLVRKLPDEPDITKPAHRICPIESPLSARLSQALAKPGQVLLGAAFPDSELLPLKALNRLTRQALRDEPTALHNYCVPQGHEKLRQQIARRMLDAGCTVSPDQVIITNGTKESVLLSLMAVTKPGDTVAIESPTFFDLIEAIGSLHLRALPIATHPRNGFCLDALPAALKREKVAACAMVTNFSNPLGACMSDYRKRALLDILARHNVPLVEDDIYGDLPFGPHRPRAVKAFDQSDSVFYCSSFSKTLSAGFRVGWCIAPRHLQTRVVRDKQSLNHCNAVLPQLVVASYLESGGYDRHLRRLRRAYQDQVTQMIQAVGRWFPQGTRVTRPRGGHVIWVEMPSGVDAMQLYHQASERGISIAPGPLFGLSEAEYRHCIRLNCGLRWSATVESAVRTLGELAISQLTATHSAA